MVKVDLTGTSAFFDPAELDFAAAAAAHRMLGDKSGAGSEFTGWLELPERIRDGELKAILSAAQRIRSRSKALVVIGIGGSYLGARGAIELLRPIPSENDPKIFFIGNGLSPDALNDTLAQLGDMDFDINVISKSGTTTEPAVAFRVFRELLEKKYGEDEAAKRIFVTTDRKKGKLKELADEKGYETFVVPDDIGGRYSVLTAVGLLPIAVAGIDIDAMMAGAADARAAFTDDDISKNDCYRYAAVRNILYRAGKTTEIMVSYDPALAMLNEWWKQLYGESEGKDGKGLYPSSVIFSTDLHSLGQYIQQGRRNIFETVIDIKNDVSPFVIPDDPANIDGMNFISGKTMHEVNHNAFLATVLSHTDGGVPNMILELDGRSACDFGYLVYFFELACAVSGYTLGVNPFDQPGVEGYKNNMYALLGKPGAEHDRRRAELQSRIN